MSFEVVMIAIIMGLFISGVTISVLHISTLLAIIVFMTLLAVGSLIGARIVAKLKESEQDDERGKK